MSFPVPFAPELKAPSLGHTAVPRSKVRMICFTSRSFGGISNDAMTFDVFRYWKHFARSHVEIVPTTYQTPIVMYGSPKSP